MRFFLYLGKERIMKIIPYIQYFALFLVFIGSFLPLVHVPILGNWNFWETDHYLAISFWAICLLCLLGIVFKHSKVVMIGAVLLFVHLAFSMYAVRYQTNDFFSFIPIAKLKNLATGMVTLKWGWQVILIGAVVLLFSSFFKQKKIN